MEEREQKINDLVDVIIGNWNNEGQNGDNSKLDIISSQSDQLLENDNNIANSDISLLSHLNTDESIELLPVNQMGGSVHFSPQKTNNENKVELHDDDQLTTDVFNFPHTYFQLTLCQMKIF